MIDPLQPRDRRVSHFDLTLSAEIHEPKCEGHGCPIRDTCLRYLRPDHPHGQTYYNTVPYDYEKENCKYYASRSGSKAPRISPERS